MGLDRDESLLRIGREEYAGIANLRFESGDLLSLTDESRFDIVSAARVLQWIREPSFTALVRALKPGGRLVALDYNHEDNAWDPDPPAEFRRFYQAFLDWRRANGWDNRMAGRLAALFASAGLSDIEVHVDDEIACRGEAGFNEASTIWTYVIQSIGPRFLGEAELALVAESYSTWSATALHKQTLVLRTVEGIRLM